MDENYKLLSDVLEELGRSGVLDELILVGSWCQYYYRILFDEAPEIPMIRTMDIDFLVPDPKRVKRSANVTKILNDLGFDTDFDYLTGLAKYVHPDLEIQFLTVAGRENKTIREIKKLNVNAESLKSLSLLGKYSFDFTHGGLTIRLPEPESFALQKILAGRERKEEGKRDKDFMAAKNIGELCLRDKIRKKRMKSIFDDMPKKWRKRVLEVCENLSSDIHSFLTRDNEGE